MGYLAPILLLPVEAPDAPYSFCLLSYMVQYALTLDTTDSIIALCYGMLRPGGLLPRGFPVGAWK